MINSVSYNATSFTLSCDTSDGIATYISEDECNIKQQLVSFSQQVVDPFTLRYSNELRWRSQGQGSYICSTRNRVAVSYAVLLTEFRYGKSICFLGLNMLHRSAYGEYSVPKIYMNFDLECEIQCD